MVAAVLTPFTALRFGVVGFGEVLIGIALLLMLILNRGKISVARELKPITNFWAAYLITILGGFFYNYFVLGYSSGALSLALFDFSSYLAVFSTVLLLADRRLYAGTTPYAFFTSIFSAWALAYSALYFLSLTMPTIFGVPLRYYQFFSPMVVNVHQAAMVTSAMPFVMLFLAWKHHSLVNKLAFSVAALLFAQMAMESGSTKAMMAIVMGGVASVLCYALNVGRGQQIGYANVARYLIIGAIVLAVGTNYSAEIALLVTGFFTEHDGSGARAVLYSVGLEHGMRSPLVGYGPGPHVAGYEASYSDAHNTMLTVFLQGGLISVFLFTVFLFRVGSSVATSSFLLGVFAAVSMYALGGDVLRRIPIWIILVGILYLSHLGRHKAQVASSSRRSGAYTVPVYSRESR